MMGMDILGVEKTEDAHGGEFAVKLTSHAIGDEGDVFLGFITNFQPNGDNPLLWEGGIPIEGRPAGISGFYKFLPGDPQDVATVLVLFRKDDENVGLYFISLDEENEYSQFNFTFTPALTVDPDYMLLGLASGDMFGMSYANSRLFIDDISLTGVDNQPAGLNSDFESWENYTPEIPIHWNRTSVINAVNRSTDAYLGKYAIELNTYVEYTEEGDPVAKSSNISTGYWDSSLNQNMGGYPYTETKDTLVFWYKYEGSERDSAIVSIDFRDANEQATLVKVLYPTEGEDYVLVEEPFDLSYFNQNLTPEYVVASATSTYWGNEDPIHVGAKLLLDEIHLKSNPLNTRVPTLPIKNPIKLYPNPASQQLMIGGLNLQGKTIEVYNMTGTLVYSNIPRMGYAVIDVSTWAKGVYIVRVHHDKKVHSERFVVQ